MCILSQSQTGLEKWSTFFGVANMCMNYMRLKKEKEDHERSRRPNVRALLRITKQLILDRLEGLGGAVLARTVVVVQVALRRATPTEDIATDATVMRPFEGAEDGEAAIIGAFLGVLLPVDTSALDRLEPLDGLEALGCVRRR